MNNILRKELKLAASPIAYYFIAFGLIFLFPGYPILCGAFFVSLGIFKSFELAREAGDMSFSLLLPISKEDIVKGKFEFAILIEVLSIILMAIIVLIRMTVLKDAEIYTSNAMMNANLFALGMGFILFAFFNLVFIGGFFKTGYKMGRPFVIYIIVGFTIIILSEAVHYIPGLEALNAFGTDDFTLQLISFIILVAIAGLITYLAYRISVKRFEKIDL